VTNRCCSQPLQRVVTDFGADVAFGQVVGKLREHYGIELASETIRGIVEGHAQWMLEQHALVEDWPSTEGAPWLVAEMDGGMVPIVTVDPAQSDRRKGKRLEWKEVKLSLVHAQDSRELHYGGTLLGGVQGAGSWLFDCAHRAGLGPIPKCMPLATVPAGSAIKSSSALAHRARIWSITTMSASISVRPPTSAQRSQKLGFARNNNASSTTSSRR